VAAYQMMEKVDKCVMPF